MAPLVSDDYTQLLKALNAHALLSITDLAGTIEQVNARFCRVSGYSEAELLGANHRLLKSGHHSHEFFESMWRTIAGGDVWQGQICNRRKDGSLYWVESTILPRLSSDSKINGYISVRTDVSRNKELENELRTLHETVRRALDKETRLFSLLSHELRTPLSAIMGLSDVLQTMEIPHKSRDYLDMIASSAESLNQTISELLNYAQAGSGNIRTRVRSYTLQELFEPTSHTYKRIAASKGLGFSCDLVHATDTFETDGRLVQEIISNLIGNAIKYTSSGEVHLRAVLYGEGEETVLSCEIEDTGPGIPEEMRKKVLDSFTQAVDYRRREYGGLGLGLTISHHLSSHLGGHLEIESGDSGTLVRLNLPRMGEEERSSVSLLMPRIRGRMALVAEDEPVQRMILAKWLSSLGCLVDLAADGAEALDRALQRSYDLIFMDLSMPNMGGLEAAMRIREASSRRKHQGLIIAMSAHDDSLLDVLVNQSGCDVALAKPFYKDDLNRLLATHFDLNFD